MMTSETKQAVHTAPFDRVTVKRMHAQETAPLDAAPLLDRVTPAREPPTYGSQTLSSLDPDATRFFDTC